MSRLCLLFVISFGFVSTQAATANAQLVPEIGYVYPAGGQAGTTVDVMLGGYDWTPDMQIFVHDPRIKMEIMGPPSPVLVPEPPYWFGLQGARICVAAASRVPGAADDSRRCAARAGAVASRERERSLAGRHVSRRQRARNRRRRDAQDRLRRCPLCQ